MGVASYRGSVQTYERLAAAEEVVYKRVLERVAAWSDGLKAVMSPSGKSMFYQLGFERHVVEEDGTPKVSEDFDRGLRRVRRLMEALHTSVEGGNLDEECLSDLKTLLKNTTFQAGNWVEEMIGPKATLPILGGIVVQQAPIHFRCLSLVDAIRHLFQHQETKQRNALRGVPAALIKTNTESQTHDLDKFKVLRMLLGLYPQFLTIVCQILVASLKVCALEEYKRLLYKQY
ncbi:hypothetical protein HDV00_008949 [Rhizophlyctis rosea]|nr:hypothetical protein HDV00_008949 [Rhizophlyctis rosea]